jgi:hypothetical protein
MREAAAGGRSLANPRDFCGARPLQSRVMMVDTLGARLARPRVFFPLLAGLAMLSVYGVFEAGLALTDHQDADLVRRVANDQSHRQRAPGRADGPTMMTLGVEP